MLNIIISVIKWSIKIILLSSLLFFTVFIFAQTRYGKDGLIGLADFILDIKYDINFKVSEVTGTVPYDIKIDRLTFYDGSGPWLNIEEFAFCFSPLQLFKGRLAIEEFKAQSIELSRVPQIKKTDKPKRPFSLPSIVYHIGLKHLEIARLTLGKEILGKPADFRIKAGITEKEIGIKSRVFVDVKRTDGIAGSALLDAEFKGVEPHLTIDARIEEPEKGLIGAILGIDTPLYMTLKGSGPLTGWDGRLSIKADQLAGIDAQVGIHVLEDTRLNIEGTAQLYPGMIPIRLNELFNPQTRFKIPVLIKSKKNLILEHATFESENLLLDLFADLDIRRMTSEGAFKLNLKDISPLGRSINMIASSGSLDIEGDFKGPVSMPAANIALTVSDFKSDAAGCDEFKAKAQIEFIYANNSSSPSLHVSGKGDIKTLFIPSLSVDPLENRLTWDLDATRDDRGEININNLQLTGDLLSAKISGVFNDKQKTGAIKALLKADSLDRYSRFMKTEIPPGMRLAAEINTQISGHSLYSRINGRLVQQNNTYNSIMNITGADIEYTGDISISDSESIKFLNIKISSDRLELTGSGLYNLDKREIHGLLDIEAKDLAAFSSIVKREIQGSARIKASIDGIMELLNINADINAEHLGLDKARFQNLSASIALSGQSLKNEGRIFLSVKEHGRTFTGDSGFKLDNKIISFKDIIFEGPGFNLKGNLTVDTEKNLTQGELNSECKDILIFAAIFNKEVHGSVNLHMNSSPSKGKNIIDIAVNANDVSGDFGKTDTIDIKLKLSGALKEPQISASASLSGFNNKNISLKSIDINALGNFQDLHFTTTGTGQAGYDINIETSGNLSLSPVRQSLRIDRFHGEYGAIPVKLKKPFKITRSKEAITFETMDFNLAGGTMNGSGNFSEDSLNFQMDFNDIPVSMLQLIGITELEGSATGNIILSGDLKQPDAKMEFTLNNLGLRDARDANMPSFRLTAKALLQSGRLEADLALDSKTTGNPFSMEMYVPVKLSFSPFSFGFPEKEDLNGRIIGDINLADIALFAGIYDQRFKGKLAIDIDIMGTVKSPEISGEARIENGSYENNSIGTLVKDIKAEISAESNRIILSSISGTDGMEGKVSGKGWFDFSPSKRFPYNLSLNLKNMALIRSNTTTMTVSGSPTISGTLNEHTLTGRLSIEKGEYRIPERLPAEITELEVTEINKSEQVEEQEQKEPVEKSVMNLDMTIEGAGQVYLTGRGIDSEWKGDLVIKGTASEPIIVGRLSILRGNYNFLGKRFDLTDGRIDLDGKYPLSPYLDVTGEASTSEITAIIKLSGDLKKPDITLSSEPSLPSDEILSQLLFGRNVSQITPVQAIQLGNALNSMLGKDSYDIIGKTKKILGVDQLELKQEVEEVDESAVSVGKYVRDDLYIEVEKGIGTESGKASVTWEVTPNITVDTEMHEDSSTGVGINWKWDY